MARSSSLPLLLAAFTVAQPAPLPAPLLPPAFDDVDRAQLAGSSRRVTRTASPGSARRGAAPRRGSASSSRPTGSRAADGPLARDDPGRGPGAAEERDGGRPGAARRDAIVVMAHRDDLGAGPGANDNASGTAALLELARAYARPSGRRRRRSSPAHTLVFLSTDGGAFGGLGALRFAATPQSRPRRRRREPRLDRASTPSAASRSPATARARRRRLVAERGRARFSSRPAATPRAPERARTARRPRIPVHASTSRAPFVARGIPAVTLTTAGSRPPDAFGDTAEPAGRRAPRRRRPRGAAARWRRSTQGLELAHRNDELRLGRRAVSSAAGRSSSC